MKDNTKDPIKVPRFNKDSGFTTTAERSALMAKIKGKNTTPEMLLRRALWNAGFRYRVDVKQLPGKPDIVFKSKKVVVFIDGEFWHGYNWDEKKTKIKANRDFWIPKIERNMQRDSENNSKLDQLGYMVFRFWANDVKSGLDNCVNKVLNALR